VRESGAASTTFIYVVVAIGVILSAIVAAAVVIAVIFIEETKTNQPIGNAGIATPPVIDATSYESGLLSWFEDSLHITLEAQNLAAFRRCSGDRDKPTCLVMVLEPSRSATPRAIAGNLARPYENQFPVAFSAVGLLFAIPPDIYSYDLRTDMIHIVAQDAWAPSLAPNGGTLAYLTTYRSGGANVRLLDLQSKTHQQLTNFEGKSPGGNFIRWLPDGMTLVFELQDDSSHNIESWSIRIDGSGLRRIVEGQIIDLGSARG
jgi:hypothetical protein